MKNKVINLTAGAFFITYFIFNVYLLPHYGISWDEPIHYQRGQVYLQNFLTGEGDNFGKKTENESIYKALKLEDSELRNYSYWIKNDAGHPPLNGILAAVSNRVFYQSFGILGDIESYHLFIVLISIFLSALVFYWTKSEYGIFAGIVSFLSLTLYPLFFAESHFNIKDPVEASFYTATLLFFYNGITKNSWKWIIASSVFAGLALGTKFNILFSVFTIAPWLVIYKFTLRTVIPAKAGIQKHRFPIRSGMTRMWIACILAPFIAFGILYATWPFLWQSPVTNLLKIFSYYKEIGSTINYQPQNYLFFGKVNTFALQWIYYATPIIILFFSFIGIFYSLRKGFNEKNKTALFILIWFLVPIIRVSTVNVGIYGGVRQIMEYIPAMAILSGIGAKYIVELLNCFIVNPHLSSPFNKGGGKRRGISNLAMKQWNNWVVFVLQLLIILSFLPITLKLISIHPNENVYFNPLVGGLEGAKEKNIIYWGNTFGNAYRQGVEWLNENVPKNSKVSLGVSYQQNVPNIWFREDILYSNNNRSALEKKGEYIIELTHDMPIWSYFYYFNYAKNTLRPLYEIKVDNVVILTIWKNDLENTKQEFKKKEEAFSINNIKKENNYILIDIQEEIFLTKLDIAFTNSDCQFTNEGYFITGDGKDTWTNHPGDLEEIAFYKNFNPRLNKDRLSYLFPSIKTRFIKVVYQENNECFKNVKEVSAKGIRIL